MGPGSPTSPIELAASTGSVRLHFGEPTALDGSLLRRLEGACSTVSTEAGEVVEASRDWWPLAMCWALEGEVAGLAGAVARPATVEEVTAVLSICNEERVPVTVAAGRSGVCGNSVPLFGGVVLDLNDLAGIVSVDDTSLIVDVLPGTFGDHFERELRDQHGLTVGHWPQSMALSTVGGWLACRGAGQLSTRYGKIEDMVVGLRVALADGSLITTGGNPRSATGPDLTQVFVGSEGTLGVICGARLLAHPAPTHEQRAAYGFASFTDGLDACRRILRRGATPAVLRLYDVVESDRNFSTGSQRNVLLVLDEGDPVIVEASMEVVAAECAGVESLDESLLATWLDHRNDVSALQPLLRGGLVVDTMEIAAPWAALPEIYAATIAAITAVDGTLAASAHQSHAYVDGACLYFTFAGKPGQGQKDAYYRHVWDAGTRAVLARGGALSHHHGVGLNRARFMREALGPAFGVLEALKNALDPRGILNPGKLGLASDFGTPEWP
ncbi:MAG: FAD-binding oxidoreductase [Actinobacteria bacterium]|nr:MAG: FAD-binding oxidoreductase [Actinomycetota bacterium]RIK03670.1 MAG: FAD-binding oxidoreductase [Acidobacteriota bacterium]